MAQNPTKDDTFELSHQELHTIRNKLNVILGYTQLLEDEENIFDDQKEMLASMADAALQMRSLLFHTAKASNETKPDTTTKDHKHATENLEEILQIGQHKPLSQKVLIVDDKKENLKLFKEILLPYGYDVFTASSGQDAFLQLELQQPELILLDVVMPQMDGYEVLQTIHQNRTWRDIPVIFLTANDAPDEIVQGLEAGAVDYIAKPFHPKELIARVHTHLEKGRLFANIKRLMEHSFHELYTPLSVISFAMQLQEMQYGKTEYTTNTHAACRTLQTIYDDLYYSINHKQREQKRVIFDLSALFQERADYFNLIAQSRDLALECSIEKRVMVNLDKEAISRVLDNLLSNAIKYTKGGNVINLILEKADQEYRLKVCNPCQKKLDIEHMFQKYYRHEEEVFGLGLGLELVQGVCERNQLGLEASQKDALFCIEINFRSQS